MGPMPGIPEKAALMATLRAIVKWLVEHPEHGVVDQLDLLGIVLPHTQTLQHNYRYREISVAECHRRVVDGETHGVHGADVPAQAALEIKTGTSPCLRTSSVVGMFDKVHARMERARVWDVEAAEAVLRQPGEAVAYDGLALNTDRRKRVLADALRTARASGSATVAVPAMVDPWRLTSHGDPALLFALFQPGSVRPLLVVATDADALEHHLGDLFASRYGAYAARMTTDSVKSQRAPSARDSVSITLGDLVRCGTAARPEFLDIEALRHDPSIRIPEDVVDWMLAAGTRALKDQLRRWQVAEPGRFTARTEGAVTRRLRVAR